jgi:hypothetical protein
VYNAAESADPDAKKNTILAAGPVHQHMLETSQADFYTKNADYAAHTPKQPGEDYIDEYYAKDAYKDNGQLGLFNSSS